ncbi:hypothetical protein EVG20_g5474 [Dentipellis fragilis]|uniref:HTH TFE/IIEalpha-type domain-containing protein n=1 Tax=Dentipellis fragilis TaxID=205917 RepID=A0A4Y9YV74_9AGAM|nr:hypothetical protein EVG20_g5474 [Dentipellis fragilis]
MIDCPFELMTHTLANALEFNWAKWERWSYAHGQGHSSVNEGSYTVTTNTSSQLLVPTGVVGETCDLMLSSSVILKLESTVDVKAEHWQSEAIAKWSAPIHLSSNGNSGINVHVSSDEIMPDVTYQSGSPLSVNHPSFVDALAELKKHVSTIKIDALVTELRMTLEGIWQHLYAGSAKSELALGAKGTLCARLPVFTKGGDLILELLPYSPSPTNKLQPTSAPASVASKVQNGNGHSSNGTTNGSHTVSIDLSASATWSPETSYSPLHMCPAATTLIVISHTSIFPASAIPSGVIDTVNALGNSIVTYPSATPVAKTKNKAGGGMNYLATSKVEPHRVGHGGYAVQSRGNGRGQMLPARIGLMITEDDKAALRLLVQHVSRAFYEPKFIVIMDQLARHQVMRGEGDLDAPVLLARKENAVGGSLQLKDDDLAGRMGLQLKELNKIMAVLEKDRLIQVHRQNELKEGAQRSVGRQYFYVDFQHFCNVVKWRVAEMRRIIDSGLRNELDNKGYICPQCGKSFSPLEVDKLIDFMRGIFICDVCHAELVDNENAENVKGSQDRMQRFNYQMRFIREGLRRSEEMVMPAFDVVHFITKNLGVDASAQNAAGETDRALKVAGSSGQKRLDEIGIVISTDKDEETIRRERDAEAAARRQQNAMPAWHLKSTITGHLTALGIKNAATDVVPNGAANGANGAGGFDESLKGLGRVGTSTTLSVEQQSVDMTLEDVKPVIRDTQDSDYYDQYYASLAASAAPSAQHTPSGDFASPADDFEEDRKPNIDYLDAVNEYKKRSRSHEDEGDNDRKVAKMDGMGVMAYGGAEILNGTGLANGSTAGGIEDDPFVNGMSPYPASTSASDNQCHYLVNGQAIPFSQITEEHQELMTPEEYTAYFEVIQARS